MNFFYFYLLFALSSFLFSIHVFSKEETIACAYKTVSLLGEKKSSVNIKYDFEGKWITFTLQDKDDDNFDNNGQGFLVKNNSEVVSNLYDACKKAVGVYGGELDSIRVCGDKEAYNPLGCWGYPLVISLENGIRKRLNAVNINQILHNKTPAPYSPVQVCQDSSGLSPTSSVLSLLGSSFDILDHSIPSTEPEKVDFTQHEGKSPTMARARKTIFSDSVIPSYWNNPSSSTLLFPEVASMDDIKQTSSLDCGFLAPLASVLALPQGQQYIQNKFRDNEDGTVSISLFNPQENGIGIEPIEIKMKKLYNHTASWQHNKYSTWGRLWVHLMERAANKISKKSFPISKEEGGLSASDSFKILLGIEDKDIIAADYYNSASPQQFKEDFKKALMDGNLPMVLTRSKYSQDMGLPAYYGQLYNEHYYAVVSPVQEINGVKGVWLFNTLNRDNTVAGLVMAKEQSRRFFMSLDEVSSAFTKFIGVKSK